jgi:hypothetical protein
VWVQYEVGRGFLNDGEPIAAYGVFRRLQQSLGTELDATPRTSQQSSAGRQQISEQRRAQRILLIRYATAVAALLADSPADAISNLKSAIGATNAIPAVATDARQANFRWIPLLTEDPAVAVPDPNAAFDTLTLYGALIVAYLQTPGYRDSDGGRAREFRRQAAEISGTRAIDRLLRDGIQWTGATGQVGPALPPSNLKVPEHVLWAVSNLQRVRLANEQSLPARYLVLEAAALDRLAALRLLVEGYDASSTLAADAGRSVEEAWSALATEGTPSDDDLARELFRLTGRNPAELPASLTDTVAGNGAFNRLLERLTADAPQGRAVRAALTWRQRLQRGERTAGVIEEIERAIESRRLGPAVPLAADDAEWLRVWYRALMRDYFTEIERRGPDRDDASHTRNFSQLAAEAGYSRYAALQSLTEPVPYANLGQALLQDWRAIALTGAALVGLWLFYAAWLAYLNVCRYRLLLTRRFYRDERSW